MIIIVVVYLNKIDAKDIRDTLKLIRQGQTDSTMAKQEKKRQTDKQ